MFPIIVGLRVGSMVVKNRYFVWVGARVSSMVVKNALV